MAGDVLLADTCVCGSTHWHKIIDHVCVWCRRCGAIRLMFQSKWMVPLDRAGEIPRSTEGLPEEPPTMPGTPGARR